MRISRIIFCRDKKVTTLHALPVPENDEEIIKPPTLSQDLKVLMKVRLNFFVLVTTFFGYLLARKGMPMEWDILFHTLIGTAAAAFGSAAFNQLMEIDLDLLMKRTADRPLPSRRMNPITAFAVGWVLSAMGIIHLAVMVSPWAAYLTAATVAIYVFIYTPMKRMSSTNTLVGAIPGAIPPVIGWVGGGGGIIDPEAWFLFGILFFWQLPHFMRNVLARARRVFPASRYLGIYKCALARCWAALWAGDHGTFDSFYQRR
jgi:protoheme IX farnesyltransferase